VAKLVYLTNASLDGYIEDEHGAFDLYEPDDDVFAARSTVTAWPPTSSPGPKARGEPWPDPA
jgi:hypothetical protein